MGFLELAMLIVPQLIKLAPDAFAAFQSVKEFIANIDRTHAQPGGPTKADEDALWALHNANDIKIANPNTNEV